LGSQVENSKEECGAADKKEKNGGIESEQRERKGVRIASTGMEVKREHR